MGKFQKQYWCWHCSAKKVSLTPICPACGSSMEWDTE